MLLAADAGAVVATPMPTVIAMAATVPVNFFIVHPCVVAMPSWRGSASGTHRAAVKTQQRRSIGFTVRPPLPFRLGQTVADHTQGLHVVPVAEVGAVHFDVLGLGRRQAQAALPRDDAVGLAVDAGGGNLKRRLPRNPGGLRNDLAGL